MRSQRSRVTADPLPPACQHRRGWPRTLIGTGPMVVPPAGAAHAPGGTAIGPAEAMTTRTAKTPSRRQNRTLPPPRLVTHCDRTFTVAAYRSAARGGGPVGFLP